MYGETAANSKYWKTIPLLTPSAVGKRDYTGMMKKRECGYLYHGLIDPLTGLELDCFDNTSLYITLY